MFAKTILEHYSQTMFTKTVHIFSTIFRLGMEWTVSLSQKSPRTNLSRIKTLLFVNVTSLKFGLRGKEKQQVSDRRQDSRPTQTPHSHNLQKMEGKKNVLTKHTSGSASLKGYKKPESTLRNMDPGIANVCKLSMG